MLILFNFGHFLCVCVCVCVCACVCVCLHIPHLDLTGLSKPQPRAFFLYLSIVRAQ